MKNLKMAAKMLVSFGIVLVMMIIIVVVSIIALTSVSSGLVTFYDKPFKNVQYADELNLNAQTAAKDMLFAMLEPDTTEIRNRLDLASSELTMLDEAVNDIRENDYRGDTAALDDIQESIDQIQTAYDAFEEPCMAGDNDKAFQIYKETIVGELKEIAAAITIVAGAVDERATQIYNEGEMTATTSTIVTIVVGCVSIGIAIFMMIYITKSLTTGIGEIHNAASKMAVGDFNINMNYKSGDEIGELADNMRSLCTSNKDIITDIAYILKELSEGNLTVDTRNAGYYVGAYKEILTSMHTLIDKLDTIMHKINESAEQVSSGSDQVSAGAQALAQGATEQASSVQELAATIHVISEQIHNNAESAKESSEKTEEAGSEMDRANAKMEELVAAMNEISQSSSETMNIIKTIEDISFQTNILALNASVEAARAGAAGKGFAVVAGEVRNLAGKSADAAKNTSDLIESTVKAIGRGNNLVNEVAQMMTNVGTASKAVADLSGKISDASAEASDSVTQVNIGVEQISNVVQTNSATAEQSAAASEELSGQALTLKELIAEFRLKNAH